MQKQTNNMTILLFDVRPVIYLKKKKQNFNVQKFIESLTWSLSHIIYTHLYISTFLNKIIINWTENYD